MEIFLLTFKPLQQWNGKKNLQKGIFFYKLLINEFIAYYNHRNCLIK